MTFLDQQLVDGILIIKRDDPRLVPFADFLRIMVDDDTTPLTIQDCTILPTQPQQITGVFDANNGDHFQVTITASDDQKQVLQLEFAEPIEDMEELSSVFASSPGVSLSAFQHILTADGGASAGTARVRITDRYACSFGVLQQTFRLGFTGNGYRGYQLAVGFVKPDGSDPSSSQGVTLRDIAALLGLMNDPHADLQWLPQELQSAVLISLTSLSARIEPADPKKLTQISVTLGFGSGRTWPVISGFPWLKVRDLAATLDVDYPLESDYRFPRLTINGTVQLDGVAANNGNAHIDLEVRWPDLAVSGELRSPEQITLIKLLTHLGIPADGLPTAKELTITQLGFLAEPATDKKRFSFHAAVENAWEIELPGSPPPKLSIESLSFQLPYQEGETPTMMPSFSGVISLGGLDIALAAEREANGWRFSGSTGPGQPIKIGAWIKQLHETFVAVTVPDLVADVVLDNVGVTFNTGTKDFHFSIEAKLPLTITAAADPAQPGANAAKDASCDLTLTLDLLHNDAGYENKFAGQIVLGGRTFVLNFATIGTAATPAAENAAPAGGTTLVAAYQNTDGDTITLRDLLTAVGVDGQSAPDLSITLKTALFAMEKLPNSTTPWKVFGVNIDGGLNLSNLPLVGKVLPPDETLSMELQVVYSSREIGKDDVEKLVNPVNALLPAGATPLPTTASGDSIIADGLSLAASLHFGTETIHLALPVALKGAPGQPGEITTTAAPAGNTPPPGSSSAAANIVTPGTSTGAVSLPADGLKWFPINKAFGPAHFERIGAGYRNNLLTLALDASLNVGGLTLSLDGLGVSSPLTKFDPTFQLRGIGVDFASGPVEIGGSFLRLGEDNFAGTAIIKAKTLTLSAIGAYRELKGSKSLFIYAVLDYPLGGPSFFFVTGLAAGFGYNRSLIMPGIDDLPTFPLVAEAVAGAGLPKDVMGELNKLEQYVPPDVGQYFLAIGVKFTSFKMIDSFALLAVSFGQRFEVDVLGLSTLIVPRPVPNASPVNPLACVSIALLARFIPDEGLLAVDARITPESYLFSPDCHLTGGFAFYSWFSGPYAGEFVLTLGGYHPRFSAPNHYPTVPRAGFNWRVVPDELVIKGDAYYALAPHALMAGGYLEASYKSGRLQAWFKVGADFLIAWQPYHYDANMLIDVGGSYDTGIGTIAVDLSANLHIWGPEFSGTAELDLYVATVSVAFGAPTQPKQFISWTEFKPAFLPDMTAVVSIALEDGLVAKGGGAPGAVDLGIVNAQELSIVTNSLVPLSQVTLGGADTKDKRTLEEPGKFGIAPVSLDPGEVKVTHLVTVTGDKGDVSAEFQFVVVRKDVPSALWGKPGNGVPAVDAGRFVPAAMSGLRLAPKNPPTPLVSEMKTTEDLEWNRELSTVLPSATACGFVPDRLPDFTEKETACRETITRTILLPQVDKARNAHLAALGLDPGGVRVGSLSGMMLSAEPILEHVSGPPA